MKRITIFWMALLMTMSVAGQGYKLTKQQKVDLAKVAKEKVERFQENCRIVAGDQPYYEKVATGGIIDIAMLDFLDGAKIEITSLDGKNSSRKPVRRYLLNLATLRKNRYKKINIKSYDCAIIENFERDLNKSRETGEEWFVGEVSIYQRFDAVTPEGRTVNDVVKRTFKVYATLHEIYKKDGSVRNYWDVKLDDIKAQNIQ